MSQQVGTLRGDASVCSTNTPLSLGDNNTLSFGDNNTLSLGDNNTLSPGGGYGGASASILPPLSLMGARGNARALFPPAAASAATATSMQETQDMF